MRWGYWRKVCGFQVDAIWTPCRFYIELCAHRSMWIPDGFYVGFCFLRIPGAFPCGFMWNALWFMQTLQESNVYLMGIHVKLLCIPCCVPNNPNDPLHCSHYLPEQFPYTYSDCKTQYYTRVQPICYISKLSSVFSCRLSSCHKIGRLFECPSFVWVMLCITDRVSNLKPGFGNLKFA
jgi:hypothetical protein